MFSHNAPQGSDQRADTSHTRAASALTMPSALFASVFHMQEVENPSSVMLQQRTPHPGAHRPAPAFESVRLAWASALPSLHTHAERRTALLRPRAPQSVHAGTNTHDQRHHLKAHAPTVPALSRPLTLPTAALTTHPTHPASYEATETQNLTHPHRLRPPCHRKCRTTMELTWLAPCGTRARKGNTGNNINKAHTQRF